ncbi:hypothetical protein NMG60_11006011 [Bertholletia excelsa]
MKMMDFGAVGLEGLVGSTENNGNGAVSDPDASKPRSSGSGFLKQARSGSGEEDWRSTKLVKTEDAENPKTMLHLQGTPLLLRSNSLLSGDNGQPQNMLSFSTSGSEVTFLNKNGGLAEKSTQNTAFHYSQQSPYAYTRNAGYGSGGLNAGVQGPVLGARGPFTPSQWIELEHQALIYKYLVANMPIPSNLLIALRKSLNPYGLSGLSSGSYAHNSSGWGSFHLGFSGNTDPEPGRCRRTDGKKWRCSRDAVADQKYCERHINRGRHRSRKPVEGRTGQAVSGSDAKVAPPIGSATSASIMSSSGATNSLGINHHQFKGAENPSADMLVNRMQEPQGISMLSPVTSLKSKDPPFAIPKPHIPIEESSQAEFGLVSSDSLLNPSQKSSYLNSRNYNSMLDFTDHESHDQHPLRQFIDDWPKDQSNRASWPEELKSDWTQLSMSIPMTSSDFSSTSSSSPQEKIALSPLRLSRELDPIQMGLAVNNKLSGLTQKQANWIPISWGSSMGGPLAEVLNSTSNSIGICKNGSPHFGSSPTGVLQKMPFVSLSNSSSGSSPRGDNKKTNETGSLGDEMLGSTLASSFPIPSLY